MDKSHTMGFKAIETFYANCRFRSRLEARHAVFFDTLGIPWEYEKEGYEFEGIRYLPDFWLPKQDCFVEIKGMEPTEEEIQKARLLAVYTQKRVCLCHGPIDRPDDADIAWERLKARIFLPPSVWTYPKSQGHIGGPSSERIDVPVDVLALMQHLSEYDLNLSVDVSGRDFPAIVRVGPATEDYSIESIDYFLSSLPRQLEGLGKYRSTLVKMEKRIKEALTLDYEWALSFTSQQDVTWRGTWMECSSCGTFDIANPEYPFHECDDLDEERDAEGNFHINTPRLIASYTAARSARFEYGERG